MRIHIVMATYTGTAENGSEIKIIKPYKAFRDIHRANHLCESMSGNYMDIEFMGKLERVKVMAEVQTILLFAGKEDIVANDAFTLL